MDVTINDHNFSASPELDSIISSSWSSSSEVFPFKLQTRIKLTATSNKGILRPNISGKLYELYSAGGVTGSSSD